MLTILLFTVAIQFDNALFRNELTRKCDLLCFLLDRRHRTNTKTFQEPHKVYFVCLEIFFSITHEEFETVLDLSNKLFELILDSVSSNYSVSCFLQYLSSNHSPINIVNDHGSSPLVSETKSQHQNWRISTSAKSKITTGTSRRNLCPNLSGIGLKTKK